MKRSALITGASDRIGRAIAIGLAQRGFYCFIHYNKSEKKAIETQQLISEVGGESAIIQADFNDEAQVSALIPHILEQGKLDLLVNNASRFVESSMADKGHELFNKLMKSNFVAPYLLTKQYAGLAEEGHIINLLDTKVVRNETKHLDYLLTKKLLRDFTLLTADMLGPKFRVNAIAPGIILPPEGEGQEYIDKLAQTIPLRRPGNTDEICKALLYLVEADFITGQIIYVDGGEHL